ncbi:Cys-tRNA(Pro) deacylase [Feifania hominis]|uniref:Cys-tRNA(Pro)/Cys-tRNA(Cys) deacylase n=1 Tax=Feifania hominis TaxID=2763660 RepID=A0A926DDN9_9FIRM|nr:Cys-tRNA(Pro) deacylase [Feifania hominis]MBC8536188.1 Cys-tRNA(Pro) deacylase [Feifania hominis]
MAEPKTNAMRILDRFHIAYAVHTYEPGDGIDGVSVAGKLGRDPADVYKTLVTLAKSGEHYVFVIPVERELDLKAAAAAVGEKAVSMLPLKDLTKVTGYIRGGCSPIGMKKLFRTVIDASARDRENIVVSAGKIGLQIETAPANLQRAVDAIFAPVAQH